jgi:hypothetical protein
MTRGNGPLQPVQWSTWPESKAGRRVRGHNPGAPGHGRPRLRSGTLVEHRAFRNAQRVGGERSDVPTTRGLFPKPPNLCSCRGP